MAIDFSAFKLQVKRYFDDSTAYTELLIDDFTNDRIMELEAKTSWRGMRDLYDFTTVAGTRRYTLSSNTAYQVNNVESMKESEQKVSLKKMALKRYEEVVTDYTQATGSPTHFIPVTDDAFYLYPTPAQNKVLTTYIYRKHRTMTADSHYFEFHDEYARVIKYGVIADLYNDRDDNIRYRRWEHKFQKGLNDMLADQRKHLNGSDARLLQGDSLE